MSVLWSALQQWSRFGIGTLVFLTMAAGMPLEAIGAFGVAQGVVRLSQSLRVAGAEAVIVRQSSTRRPEGIALILAICICLGMLGVGLAIGGQSALCLVAMAPLPLALALSGPSEGILRRQGRYRALALRTLLVQCAALGVAGGVLWTSTALAAVLTFTVVQTVLSAAVTIAMAQPALAAAPHEGQGFAHLMARDMLTSAMGPALQLAVTLSFGLAEGGLFLLALKLIGLIDTLAIAPLRFVALPQLCKATARDVRDRLVAASALVTVASFGLLAWVGPAALSAVMPNARAAALEELCLALLPFGAAGALSMPWIQALIATKDQRVPLLRALALVCGSVATVWALQGSSLATLCLALSLGAGVVYLWLLLLCAQRLNASWLSLVTGPATLLTIWGISLATYWPGILSGAVLLFCAAPLRQTRRAQI